MTGDQDYTAKPGHVIYTDNTMTESFNEMVKAWYDTQLINKLGNTVQWTKYTEREQVMDHTDRTICKHWFDMFLKNHPEWKFVINHEDPFYKKGGFKVTNGKHTMSHSYPSSDIHVTPKLPRRTEQDETTQLYMDSSFGVEFTVISMKSFIAWAMGIEPLPKELQ